MRQPLQHPFILVGCYRSDPTESTDAWIRVLGELQKVESFTQLEVAELETDATYKILAEIFTDCSFDRIQALASRILPITGGNPFFVREVATQLKASGSVDDQHAHLQLPSTLLSDISGRLRHLNASAREIVDLASILGPDFTLDHLATVADRSVEGTLSALDEARDARLVDAVPNKIDLFAFRHALIREAVYELMSPSRRLRAHLAAGTAYKDRDDMASVFAKAHHLLEAVPICRPETAARATIDAADAALARLAFEDAIQVLTRSLELNDEAARISDSTSFEIFMRLGRAYSYRGETSASEAAFNTASDIARVLQDPIRLASAALGDDLDTRPLTPSSTRLELLREALQATQRESALSVAVASAYVAMGSLTTEAARVQELSKSTVEAARRINDPAALSKALLARLTCTNSTASPGERLALSTEALQLAEASGQSSRAARARLIRLGTFLRLGRLAEAHDDHRRYRAAAESTKVPRHLWHADVVAAALDRLRGQFESSQVFAERALQTGKDFGLAEAQMVYTVHLFFLHLHRGSLADLQAPAEAYSDARPDLLSWKLSAALAARAASDLKTAHRNFDEFIEILPELDPDGEFWSAQLLQAAQLAYELDVKANRATLLWEVLSRRSGEFEVFGATTAFLGPVDRALGGLAAQRGENQEAVRLRPSDGPMRANGGLALVGLVGNRSSVAACTHRAARPG